MMKNFNKKDVLATLKMMWSDKVDMSMIASIACFAVWGFISKNYDLMGSSGTSLVFSFGAVYRMAYWKNKVAELKRKGG